MKADVSHVKSSSKIIGKKMQNERKLELAVDRMLEATKAHKKIRRGERKLKYLALAAIYKVLYLTEMERNETNLIKILNNRGIKLRKGLSPATALVNATEGYDSDRANLWGNVLLYALEKGIRPDDLISFVKEKNGITKCCHEYRARKNRKEAKAGLATSENAVRGRIGDLELQANKEVLARLSKLKDGNYLIRIHSDLDGIVIEDVDDGPTVSDRVVQTASE